VGAAGAGAGRQLVASKRPTPLTNHTIMARVA